MNSIKLQNRLGNIFTNSQNSKPFEPYRLLLNISNKINLR